MTIARTALLAGVALALPFAASAQSADSKYCHDLSAKYREYARAGQADPEAAGAMGLCDKDSGRAIPILEKHLNAAKVPLPKRG